MIKIYTVFFKTDGNLETPYTKKGLVNFQRKINAFIKNHPEGQIKWKQSSATEKWNCCTQMTAIITC